MSPVLTFWCSVCVMTDYTKFIYILFQMIYRSVVFFFPHDYCRVTYVRNKNRRLVNRSDSSSQRVWNGESEHNEYLSCLFIRLYLFLFKCTRCYFPNHRSHNQSRKELWSKKCNVDNRWTNKSSLDEMLYVLIVNYSSVLSSSTGDVMYTPTWPIRSQSQLSIMTSQPVFISSNNWFKPNWSETLEQTSETWERPEMTETSLTNIYFRFTLSFYFSPCPIY